MEWKIEENFSMEWNMEWKTLVWNGNAMEENCQYGIWKNHLPFHTMPIGLLPLPFHPHSRFHTLNVTDIPLKANRCD